MERLLKRQCGECGKRELKLINLKNTWVEGQWKDFPRVYIERDVMEITCGHCGEAAGTSKSAKDFDTAARESIQHQVSFFINRIKDKTKFRLTEIAERTSMGYQHLSDLKNGRSFPSYHYWGLLHSFSKKPELLEQLNPEINDAPPLSHHG